MRGWEILSSAGAVDVALTVLGVEAVALMALRGRRWGIEAIDVVGQLLSGAMLLIALRCVLVGASRSWALLFLSASFPAHVFDLARRARGNGSRPSDSRT